ncbi:DUF1572 family protein [Fictibacillus phosphorivorans]|uniref:DUF1572 family protein n=1 Tax=Fictibacillus phosphorivorans TaxID=1221500 RepID=UPI00203C6D34|nr:DUF1572 family protein [Fictibacillus phosphorivorans]MCM3719035.1 DUF1572 domain-containing protein [Fictibacillus phosphorivorans]MCM3776657.1 DUF1572 domain-containing protein [Fictibacillus phosphorivorans]
MSLAKTDVATEYLRSIKKRFLDAKDYAERTFDQLSEEQLFWYPNEDSNSVAIIVKHISGNMISRWTDMFNTDGEKPDRNRDGEFENTMSNREEMKAVWDKGWGVFFDTLDGLKEEDLLRTIYIRNEPHSVMDAINNQMYHYSNHIGQIIYIAKMLKSEEWKTLTIPRKK